MNKGWIGVDLDATLAHYDGWTDGSVGEPVQPMLERVKGWLAEGKQVKIFTARATVPGQLVIIHKWLIKHGLPMLEVTCVKDMYMVQLWDDRAVQVIPNTGMPVGQPDVHGEHPLPKELT